MADEQKNSGQANGSSREELEKSYNALAKQVRRDVRIWETLYPPSVEAKGTDSKSD